MVTTEELWNPKFETGIAQIDAHHKTLLSLVVELRNAIEAKADSVISEAIVDSLISYSKYHFLAEERYMLEMKYPYLDLQREEHRKFSEKVAEEFRSARAPSREKNLQMLEFLKNWFIDHILIKDKDFGEYISKLK